LICATKPGETPDVVRKKHRQNTKSALSSVDILNI